MFKHENFQYLIGLLAENNFDAARMAAARQSGIKANKFNFIDFYEAEYVLFIKPFLRGFFENMTTSTCDSKTCPDPNGIRRGTDCPSVVESKNLKDSLIDWFSGESCSPCGIEVKESSINTYSSRNTLTG